MNICQPLAVIAGTLLFPAIVSGVEVDYFDYPTESDVVTCGFGVTCARPHHLGVDLCAEPGDPVYAPAHGTVREAQVHRGYGGTVVIEHSDGGSAYTSIVAHMRVRDLAVQSGDEVRRGETLLGYVGTREENGNWEPHVHWGVHLGGYDSAMYDCAGQREWTYAGYTSCPDEVLPQWADPATLVGRSGCEDLVGQFDGAGGDDIASAAFVATFQHWSPRLGCPEDAGGTAYVHDVFGVVLQDFLQDDSALRFEGSDGWTALAYNVGANEALLLRTGFWGTYKCLSWLDEGGVRRSMGGAVYLGAPVDEEHGPLAGDPVGAFSIQNFERGYLWWDGTWVHVHLNDHHPSIDDWDATRNCLAPTPVIENPPECPVEVCDGEDNDCDGSVDEGYTCVWATERACVASCGSAGIETCNDACLWSNCVPPSEVCNAVDDDCDGQVDEGCVLEVCDGLDNDGDGQIDEGFTCVHATQQVCVTGCGSAGIETCNDACLWSNCVPPAEVCNGADDDCDGAIDNGVANSCTNYATCLPISQCAACPPVPAEVCGNAADDNCDGRVDEGCVPACDVPAITWTQLADLPAGGGEISVGGVLEGIIYLAGLGVATSFYSFDPVSEAWTQLPDMPERRDGGGGVGASFFPDPARFYVLGQDATADVLRYDPAQNTWDRGSAMPTPRSYFGMGFIRMNADTHGLAYSIGGWRPDSANLERYDTVTDEWSVGPQLDDARGQMAVASFDGFMYVFGGTNSVRVFNTVERLGDDLVWEGRTAMTSGRRLAAALPRDTHIYVMGGISDANATIDATDVYDPAADSWCDGTPLPEPLQGFLAVTVANEFYVFGGTGPADASPRVYRGTFP